MRKHGLGGDPGDKATDEADPNSGDPSGVDANLRQHEASASQHAVDKSNNSGGCWHGFALLGLGNGDILSILNLRHFID